jgi:hypothetical protein
VSVCWIPEQADSKGAPSRRPKAVRRVAPVDADFGSNGSAIVSLLLGRHAGALPLYSGRLDSDILFGIS